MDLLGDIPSFGSTLSRPLGSAVDTDLPPLPDWMRQCYADIRWRTLRQTCLPFSHDSAMSRITSTSLQQIPPAQFLTQRLDIGKQLAAGARFFDIRPVAAPAPGGVTYGLYHGQNIDNVGLLGATGQPLQEVCDQINSFASQHAELIILEVSHCLSGVIATGVNNPLNPIDADGVKLRNMSQSQYEDLFRFLTAQLGQYLYICPNPQVDLTMLPVADFIGDGKTSVIITLSVDDIEIPPPFLGNGFFYGVLTTDVSKIQAAAASGRRSQLCYSGTYAGKDDANTVANNQLQQLGWFRNGDWLPPFLMEYTITQQYPPGLSQYKGDPLPALQGYYKSATYSIKGGAMQMRPLLYQLLGKVTREIYPTMVGVDFFNSDVTQIAVKINTTNCRPFADIFRWEMVAAFWGPRDVTQSLSAAFNTWLQNDTDSMNPYSTGPFTTLAACSNHLLGDGDPSFMVRKQLVVLMRRYHNMDSTMSYAVQFSAWEDTNLVLDPAQMTLKNSYAQGLQTLKNQQSAGPTEWGVVSAMYGPIDRAAFGTDYVGQKFPIPAINCLNQISTLTGPGPLTSSVTFTVKLQADMSGFVPTTTPSELRVLLYQRCKTDTAQTNKANATLYALVSGFEGQTVSLGPGLFVQRSPTLMSVPSK